jgi:hypothetical protein
VHILNIVSQLESTAFHIPPEQPISEDSYELIEAFVTTINGRRQSI